MVKRRIGIAVLILITISLAVFYKVGTSLNISNVNENLNMGKIKLLIKEEDIKEKLESQFTMLPGFGFRGYYNKNDGIKIEFSGYQDVVDGLVLTRIETTNPMYSIYGISVGQNLEAAVKILNRKGFRRLKTENINSFKKGTLAIAFDVNSEGKIENIFISLSSTNKDNVIF